MRALTVDEIIGVWERADALHPLDRCLAMLALAAPEWSFDDLARLPIGTRDRWLLELREQTFGSRLEAFVSCPRCALAHEFELSTDHLRAPPAEQEESSFDYGDVRACLRPPNSRDLANLLRLSGANAGLGPERLLAASCIVKLEGVGLGSTPPAAGSEQTPDAEHAAKAVWVDALPATAFEQLGERLSDLDPQASIELNLSCRGCDHRWSSLFDVGSYLWDEVARAARRALAEVDAIARCYGWSEAQILGLSPRRRSLYLQLTSPD